MAGEPAGAYYAQPSSMDQVAPPVPEVIGLLAGSGRLPFTLARAAGARGLRVIAAAHHGETDPALEHEVDACTWVRLGQLGRIAKALREGGASRAILAGGLRKAGWFSGARPDLAALKLVAATRARGDDGLLRAIAGWFAGQGLEIVAPHGLLDGCFAEAGLVAGRPPTPAELSDAAEGVRVARILGAADVGQTVAVRDGAVLAVEAMEGTDACIRRAGTLAEHAVIVKSSKPGQDRRFDLPAIGPATIAVMAEAGAGLLAVEAGTTIVLDREELRAAAGKARVSVVGLRG